MRLICHQHHVLAPYLPFAATTTTTYNTALASSMAGSGAELVVATVVRLVLE